MSTSNQLRHLSTLVLVLPWLVIAVACQAPAPTPTPSPTPTPTPAPLLAPLLLPADEAPHRFTTEWWYYNIHLSDEEHGRYALHYVVFQLGEPSIGRFGYVAQVGFADPQSGSYVSGERVALAGLPPENQAAQFSLQVADWTIEGTPGRYRLKAGLPGVAFDLELASDGPALLHGADGLVDFGSAGVSYYYTRPRLNVSGLLTIEGQQRAVSGLAWMDKQWGNFRPVTLAWDWASIQLDSGIDLMLTRVVDSLGQPLVVYGTLRRADGTTQCLRDDEFTLEPVAGSSWSSPQSTIEYPVAWKVSIPSAALDLTLTALVPQSEYASGVTGVVYWEGGMSAHGTENGMPVRGQGFVELTNHRFMGR